MIVLVRLHTHTSTIDEEESRFCIGVGHNNNNNNNKNRIDTRAERPISPPMSQEPRALPSLAAMRALSQTHPDTHKAWRELSAKIDPTSVTHFESTLRNGADSEPNSKHPAITERRA